MKSDIYLVYLLKCENRTYIGMTNDFFHRWRQHIGEIKGGAKYTSKMGKDWYPICIIDGFKSKKEACQCEWRWKRKKGDIKRVKYINDMIQSGKWTKNSPLIEEQNLRIYVDNDYKKYIETIKTIETKELYWK